MRDTFVKTLMDIAEKDDNVILITGDLGFGVLKPFWEKFPDQFINAGIAEQDMTGFAAGMALSGKTVFTYSIGNFPTLRCIEQIRNDCAYHDANVKIVCVGGGFTYGSLGMSHHATEDIAVMRAMPGVTVMAPGDLTEAQMCTTAAYDTPGTCYLRLGRGGEPRIHSNLDSYKPFDAIKIKDGEKIAVFSTGAIFEEAKDAITVLNKDGMDPALYTFPFVKPIDSKTITECAQRFDLIVTVEEHNIVGGFGGAVAEVLASVGGAKLLRIGLKDTYSSIVGTQKYLRQKYSMDSAAIARKIRQAASDQNLTEL